MSTTSFVVHLVDRFPELRDALEKLQLNDAALKVVKLLICHIQGMPVLRIFLIEHILNTALETPFQELKLWSSLTFKQFLIVEVI